jgi:hypothetical protein
MLRKNNYPQFQNKSGSRVRFYQGGMETLITLPTDFGNRPPQLVLQEGLFLPGKRNTFTSWPGSSVDAKISWLEFCSYTLLFHSGGMLWCCGKCMKPKACLTRVPDGLLRPTTHPRCPVQGNCPIAAPWVFALA